MKATTIKLEGKILDELKNIKESSRSITSLVKEILQQEINRRKLYSAGLEYAKLLKVDKEEKKHFEEWESSDLTNPPKKKKL